MTVPANWREDAACRDADPDLFFPISTTGNALRQVDEAKRICRACPSQVQCLAWALEHGVTDGVWGATTEGERRAIRSHSRRTARRLGLGEGESPRSGDSASPSRKAGLARRQASQGGHEDAGT